MRRRALEFLFLVIVLLASQFVSDNLQPELFGIAIGIAGAFLIDFFDWLIQEWKFLMLYWDCYKPWTDDEIRLSIAYLFRIEVNGKYLLIKSSRIKDTYQPVGGVYKYYNPEAKKELDCMGAITDNNIDNDEISECDLRLKLLNRKKIKTFLKWFFKREKREIDPWREFYEELILPGILPSEKFGYIHYEHIGQHFEPIHRDKFFKIDTFKYCDIFIPKFVNTAQILEIKKLATISDSRYIWVTEEEIRRGKSHDNHLIAGHTNKIFHSKMF